MINKKTINKIKTENFIKEFPILFIVQHNSFTINDWFEWKQKIQNSLESKGKISEIEFLNIKNSLFKKIVESSKASENTKSTYLSSVFQGPLVLLGCKNEDHLEFLWNSFKLNPKLIFICCLYKNQLLNHLDFETLLKTNPSIYQNLLTGLDKKTEIYNIIYSSLPYQPLDFIQYKMLTQLSLIK